MSRGVEYNALIRERTADLKEAGLCARCGRLPARPGKSDCATCARMRSDGYKARMAQKRAQGICTRCSAPAEAGRIMCRTHTDEAAQKRNYYRGRESTYTPGKVRRVVVAPVAEDIELAIVQSAHRRELAIPRIRRYANQSPCGRCGEKRPDAGFSCNAYPGDPTCWRCGHDPREVRV